MNAAPTPSNADHNTIVDVALAVVVDNLSDQSTRQAHSNSEANSAAMDRARINVLIARRKAEQVLGGYWELPGGKVQADESPRDAAVRELREEVGIDAEPIHTLPTVTHQYEHAHVRLHPFICLISAGTPSAIQVDEVRWVRPDELSDYRFPQATLPVLADFIDWLNTPKHATIDKLKHQPQHP